jgi:hypothetical protein
MGGFNVNFNFKKLRHFNPSLSSDRDSVKKETQVLIKRKKEVENMAKTTESGRNVIARKSKELG